MAESQYAKYIISDDRMGPLDAELEILRNEVDPYGYIIGRA